MENNFDDEEKKYFSNRMFLNKLGDTREFGNFYELIYNRKVKILSFLNKDLNQINNPDFRQFESLEHALIVIMSLLRCTNIKKYKNKNAFSFKK